jgi:thiamine-phosphate pyrophosphorylase
MTRSEIDAFFTSLHPNAVYGLCDQALLDAHDFTLKAYTDLCRQEDVALIQYRSKGTDPVQVRAQLAELRGLWDGVLIINDHWQMQDLCDGVHIGQEDLEVFGDDAEAAAAALRDLVGPSCILGLSTHNLKEIETANRLPIDYIGLGAFRATGTKCDAAVLGEDLDALAAASLHPVAAIGGVGFDDHFEHARMRVMGSALLNKAKTWK